MRVGDVYQATKDVAFIQGPLYRKISKGDKLWVKEVNSSWPVMERADGDYAFFGQFLNEFIENGTIVKIARLPYPLSYYKDHQRHKDLMKEAKEIKSRLKTYKK